MHALIDRISRRLFPPTETLVGYEHPELVEVAYKKTAAYRPSGPWPEVSGASSVLDFGGGFGVHYKQAQSDVVRWAIVETPAVVARAAPIETNNLRFFTTIEAAARWLGPIDLIHSNGALQYSAAPEQTIRKLCALRARKIIWDRVMLASREIERLDQVSHLVDNGPGRAPFGVKNKAVTYTCTKIPETTFLSAHEGYSLTARGADWFRYSLM